MTCPLVTVCVSLLDLVIALAKFLLVLVFSVEDTCVQAHSLSWQPSLRAFHWWSFVTSFLYWSRPICSLVGSENPFLTVLITCRFLCRWPGGSYMLCHNLTIHITPSDLTQALFNLVPSANTSLLWLYSGHWQCFQQRWYKLEVMSEVCWSCPINGSIATILHYQCGTKGLA